MQLYIDGVGIWSAGLASWPEAAAVLRGDAAYRPEPLPLPTPLLLPAAERRRSPATVRLALQVAVEACAMAQVEAANLPCVFASSHGDTEISDYMCNELAQPQPALSPTKFHNSVHNAASGYWTIAVGCTQAANAISAGDHSCGAGLLEAAALALDHERAALLVAYDMAAPKLLLPLCPILESFAVALVLSPRRSAQSIARLRLAAAPVTPTLPAFALALMHANPAARALPLLHALARQATATLSLAGATWEVSPCH